MKQDCQNPDHKCCISDKRLYISTQKHECHRKGGSNTCHDRIFHVLFDHARKQNQFQDKQDQKEACEDTAEIADSFGIALQEIAEGGKTKHDPAQRYGYFFDYIFHCQNLT